MRYQGTITRWNDERGFGFVTPNGGGDEVFAHISDFPRRYGRPDVGDRVIYEIADATGQRRKAVNIAFADRRTQSAQHTGARLGSMFGALLKLLVLAGIGYFGYLKLHDRYLAAIRGTPVAQPHSLLQQNSIYRCEGKRFCSQMNSCEEATFYLDHCPNTAMDGDRDGIPCEDQWCH